MVARVETIQEPLGCVFSYRFRLLSFRFAINADACHTVVMPIMPVLVAGYTPGCQLLRGSPAASAPQAHGSSPSPAVPYAPVVTNRLCLALAAVAVRAPNGVNAYVREAFALSEVKCICPVSGLLHLNHNLFLLKHPLFTGFLVGGGMGMGSRSRPGRKGLHIIWRSCSLLNDLSHTRLEIMARHHIEHLSREECFPSTGLGPCFW